MSGSIASIELRRGGALATGLLIAVPGLAGLVLVTSVGDGAPVWAGQWVQLATFGRTMLLVLGPLAVTAGAWQGRRERRFRMDELLQTTSVSGWRRQLPLALTTALCLALGDLLILVAGAPGMASDIGWSAKAGLAVAATGATAVVAAGWLGFGIGRVCPFVFTPAVAGVGSALGLSTAFEAAKSGDDNLFLPVFAGQFTEYDTVASPVSIGQAVWFGGLACGGLILALATGRLTRPLALIPPLLGLAVAAPMLVVPAAVADPRALTEVCTHDGGPRVCVIRIHAGDLSGLVGPARQALRRLATLPDSPTSVHEVTADRGYPQPASQVWFDSDNHQASGGWGTRTPDELTVRILLGGGTRQCARSQEDGTYLAVRRARVVVAAWLYGTYPAPGLVAAVPAEEKARTTAWQQLSELPANEQERRVAAVRAAGLTCGDQAAAAAGSSR
ncbi:hypothetical protein [Actinoplanes sp. NPDC049265]|uniref:hypothetical protein n=1 Tax=Actinoplanes sp. NPDC049265 TaxID=3363902 RepID=UPI00371B7D5F